jgi:hypothetical protein
MPDNLDDRPFAAIEPLDPDPVAPAHRSHRAEIALGVLLVCAVIAAALWQWWGQQAQQTHYQAGRRAAAARTWEQAGAEYQAAGAFRDAPAQATAAARTITERNQLYGLATTAAQRGAWPRVLELLPRLRAIAPTYRDVPQLDREAQQQALPAALSGTVALRTDAQPPGLYRYGAGGWQWLPQSDPHSRLEATCPDGALVYDGPADAPAPAPAGPDDLAGRRLWWADPAGPGAAHRGVALDPAPFQRFRCNAGGGVWGLRIVRGMLSPSGSSEPIFAYETAFDPGDGRVLTATLPGPGWSILDVAPDNRLLVLSQTVSLSGDSRKSLYLAAPGGGDMRLVDTRLGSLDSLDFSPDGRYLLVAVNRVLASTGAVNQSAVLIDTTGAAPPRSVAEVETPIYDGESLALFGLRAGFLRQGPRTGQVLLTWPAGAQQMLRLVDPAQPRAPLLEARAAARYAGLRLLTADLPGGGLVLGTTTSWDAQNRLDLALVYLDDQGRVHETRVPQADAGTFAGAWVRGGRLVYARNPATRDAMALNLEVASLPLGAFDAPVAHPTLLYSGTVASWLGYIRLPWWPGPALLAYTAPDGRLHVVTYDGDVDMPLGTYLGGFPQAVGPP